MLRAVMGSCLFAACVLAVPVCSPAQEMIHCLTGTISSVDAQSKTLTVLKDTGSEEVFHALTDPKSRIVFDKRIEAESTAAHAFDKQGAYAIVFFFGIDDSRTAVAVKALGAGPFSSVAGVVIKFDHGHSITVQDASGAQQTIQISADTIAETMMGATLGPKLDAHKGDHVRIVSSQANGASTALFVRDL
ncbi:MAG TPA: hypothetical protein VGJ21_24035 [Terracidiphilus sp.]